jgi:ornithine carbamoyltransferase
VVRHFLGQNDLDGLEMERVFERAGEMKRDKISRIMAGRSLVMFFEKASTRTRLSFEIGMGQMGGQAVHLDRDSSQLARGESIADTARVVSRYADLIMARVFLHSTVQGLAEHATIPVINGLSDDEHPCQSLTDLFTIAEHKGQVRGIKITFVGDGNNNVTHSLMLGATLLGAHITVAAPAELQPQARYVDLAEANARATGGSVRVMTDPIEAVRGADVLYADVWVSMGREADMEYRIDLLRAYQVNNDLIRIAGDDCIFMHCLPAHIDEEVTADVAYGPRSVIFDQAENRLHIQKALMEFLLLHNVGGV